MINNSNQSMTLQDDFEEYCLRDRDHTIMDSNGMILPSYLGDDIEQSTQDIIINNANTLIPR